MKLTNLLLGLCICLAVFTAVTNTDNVKLLAEPASDSVVVKTLRLGDVVKVLTKSPDGQYWQVEHKGTGGWIIHYHLSPKDYRYSTEA